MKRDLETWSKQHFKNGDIEKLTVAAYIWTEKKAMDRKLILLKKTSNKQKLIN